MPTTSRSREDKKDHKKKINIYQSNLERAIEGKDSQALYQWITAITDEDMPVSGIRQLISQFMQSKLVSLFYLQLIGMQCRRNCLWKCKRICCPVYWSELKQGL